MAALDTWTPAHAVAMTVVPGTGAGQQNQWRTTFTLPAGTAVQYKYILRDGSGNTAWEGGGNRAVTTPVAGGTLSLADRWR